MKHAHTTLGARLMIALAMGLALAVSGCTPQQRDSAGATFGEHGPLGPNWLAELSARSTRSRVGGVGAIDPQRQGTPARYPALGDFSTP